MNLHASCIDMIKRIIIDDETIVRDSSYFNENGNEWSHKFYSTNNKIDSMVYDRMDGSNTSTIRYIYARNSLTGVGVEYLVNRINRNDSIITTMNYYKDGDMLDSSYAVYANNRLYETNVDVQYSEIYETITTIKSDTIEYIETSSNSQDEYKYLVIKKDENLCLTVESGVVKDTVQFSNTNNGFYERVSTGSYVRYFYFNDSTDPLPTEYITKRRYINLFKKEFDLIGRAVNR
jgi:hypothetical protein